LIDAKFAIRNIKRMLRFRVLPKITPKVIFKYKSILTKAEVEQSTCESVFEGLNLSSSSTVKEKIMKKLYQTWIHFPVA